jgi:hypothetical protein
LICQNINVPLTSLPVVLIQAKNDMRFCKIVILKAEDIIPPTVDVARTLKFYTDDRLHYRQRTCALLVQAERFESR